MTRKTRTMGSTGPCTPSPTWKVEVRVGVRVRLRVRVRVRLRVRAQP